MTALKPIENRRVRGVSANRYPLNEGCSHPECSEPAVDPHHIFPRSNIGNDSWFVEIEIAEDYFGQPEPIVIPHVTGLCRAHHDDVEEHRAWIKLEEGRFVWYDHRFADIAERNEKLEPRDWERLDLIDPQPAGRDKTKKKRRRFQGQAKRQRGTVSIRVPQDEREDGAGLLDDAIAQLEEKLGNDPARPPYYVIMDALNHTLLNA